MKKIVALLLMTQLIALTSCTPAADESSGSSYVADVTSQAETLETTETESAATEVGLETASEEETSETATEYETVPASQEVYDFSFDYSLLGELPTYSGEPYTIINNNVPFFEIADTDIESFEYYGDRDSLGRCTCVYSCIGRDLMPTEERGPIGMVKPSGWQLSKYDFVDGKYLFNRCHLIGYQLTAENANESNLITGTRYLNIQGMLPFENRTAEYVSSSGNHVMYRVTPIFDGDNLVARGVLMEAESVEDHGTGLCFNVFCFNVQPGVVINYVDGTNWLDASGTEEATEEIDKNISSTQYILNTRSKKIHYPWCSSVNDMAEHNKREYSGSIEDIQAQGYEPCKRCNPQ